MAILTKNQLSASNASSFPDNTTGAITPQILRDFNTNIIDTLVDSLVTSSFALTDASNNFTSANSFSSISASSFVSASGFVGDGSKITNITSSIALPILDEGIPVGNATSMNFTGSNISAVVVGGIAVVQVTNQDTGSLLTTASFNQYTASNDSKVNSLINATASYAISSSVAAVDAAQQAQINSLIAATASFASLNAFTASQETKDATLETYTASVDQQFSNIGSQSASWDNTNLNAFTASQNTKNSTLASYTGSNDTKWNTLGSLSGSFITESETGSFAILAASNRFTQANSFTSISASSFVSGTFFVGDGSKLTNLPGAVPLTSLNAFTASQETKNATLETYTASVDSKFISIGASTSSLNTATASLFTSASLGLTTASFTGNTLTFRKGDGTTFGVVIPDVSGSGTPTGTISSSAQITALGFVSSSVTASSLVTASFAAGTLTFTKGNGTTFGVVIPDNSGSAAANTIFEVVYTGENITKGDPLYISGSQGANPIVFKADAAVPAKMPVTFVSNETIGAGNTTNAIILGLIEGIDLTGYTAGQAIYVAEGGGWSTSLPSGSNSVTQLLGVVTKGGSGGKGLVLNPGPAQLPGLDTGKIWVGGSTNQAVEITTASFATTGSNTFVGNQTISGSILIASGSNITLASNGTIVGGNVNGIPSIQLIPTASQLLTDKIVIYNDYTGLQNTQYNITIGSTALTYANGVSASFFVTSSTNASSTLNWWYGGATGSGDITPESGTVSINGSGNGSFGFLVNNDNVPFVIYVSDEQPFTNPYANQNGARSLEINGNQFQSIYNVNLSTGNLQSSSIVLGTSDHGVRTDTDGGVTLTSFDYTNPEAYPAYYSLTFKNGELKATSSVNVDNANLSIQSGNNLNLDSVKGANSSVSLRSAGDAVIRVGNNFVDNEYQSRWRFRPGVSTNDGYIEFPDATEQYTAFNQAALAGFGLVTTGSNTFSGSQIISTGSLQITGSLNSNVVSVSIVSSTASMDMSAGNYFTVTLPSTQSTNITATNIKPGSTATLVITTKTASTASLSPILKQTTGDTYSPNQVSGSTDILQFVAVDSVNMFTILKKTYTAVIPPPPIDQDLTIYLDAGNASSYPGTGTMWYDLTANNNDLKLFGSPAWDSTTGSFDFANTTTTTTYYATGSGFTSMSIASGSFSIELWQKYMGPTSGADYVYNYELGFIDTGGANTGGSIQFYPDWVSGQTTMRCGNIGITRNIPVYTACPGAPCYNKSTDYNVWRQLVLTRNGSTGELKMYVDGAIWDTLSGFSDTLGPTDQLTIGSTSPSNTVYGQSPGICQTAIFKCWNGKVVSSTEVLDSYNALKTRFGK